MEAAAAGPTAVATLEAPTAVVHNGLGDAKEKKAAEEAGKSAKPTNPGAVATTPVRVSVGGGAAGGAAAASVATTEPSSPAVEAPASPAAHSPTQPAPRAAAPSPAASSSTAAAPSAPTAPVGMSPVPPARPTAVAVRPGSLRKVAEPVGGLTPVPGSADVNDTTAKATRPASAARAKKRPPSACRPQSALTCPICLDPVTEGEGRSTAALACGHKFHLSCIGSAFNAKGAMVCPLCRREEDDEWRYADGLRPEDDWDPADLGEADAALFYPSDEEYDEEEEGDAEYWCEELPVLWRIHAAPVRYVGELTDEEEYDDDEDDEDVEDDGLDDDASIDEDFDPRYTDEDDYVDSQRQVFLRGRPLMMHQYVELSNVYDEREAEEDELDDDIAERQLGARSSASASEATATAAAAATAAGTEDGAPAAGSNLDDPIPEDELGDAAAGALGQEGSLAAPTGGAAGASTRTGAAVVEGGAAALRLRPRHVLHFGRVLSYGGQPRWSDLSFDGVDGSVGLAPARYCYVANLELGLLPSAER